MRKTLLFILMIFFTSYSFVHAQQKMYKKVETKKGTYVAEEMSKVIYVDSKNQNHDKYANMDTLIWLNVDNLDTIPDIFNGGEWINFSYDNLTPANPPGDPYPSDYFILDSVIIQDINTGDTLEYTRTLASVSWMAGFATGNRNVLTTPEVTITQPGAVLSFTSMPWQGPQWADGYSLIVTPSDNVLDPNGDTLMQHKQYRGAGDGPVWHPSYGWDTIPGDTMHTVYNYDASLATFEDSGNTTLSWSYWEFPLDAYVGQSIYVSWYHDSDDDNGIMFADLLIVQPQASGLDEKEFNYSRLYPNPSSDLVTFEFKINDGADEYVQIVDMQGRAIKNIEVQNDGFGVQKVYINNSELQEGLYLVKYFNGKSLISQKLYVE